MRIFRNSAVNPSEATFYVVMLIGAIFACGSAIVAIHQSTQKAMRLAAETRELIDTDAPTFEDELKHAQESASRRSYGAASEKPQSSEKPTSPEELRHEFDSKYRAARTKVLKYVDYCQACGRRDIPLETHHVISVKRIFDEGLPESLVYDPNNLEVLCRGEGGGCHLKYGHLGSFKQSNADVRLDAGKQLGKVLKSKTTVAP